MVNGTIWDIHVLTGSAQPGSPSEPAARKEISMNALSHLLGAGLAWVGRSMAIMSAGMSGVPKVVERADEFTRGPKPPMMRQSHSSDGAPRFSHPSAP
jgi:hypothetical protein